MSSGSQLPPSAGSSSRLLLLTLLAGCGSAPPAAMPAVDDIPLQFPAATEWPGAAKLLHGFAAADEDAGWRQGDALLFGVRFQNGDEAQRYLIHLWTCAPASPGSPTMKCTVTPKDGSPPSVFVSHCAAVQITIYEADGRLAANQISIVSMPQEFFDRGITGYGGGLQWRDGRVLLPDGSTREPTAAEHAAGNEGSMFAAGNIQRLLETLQNDDLQSPFFWRIVDKPIGAVLLAFGQVRVVTNLGNLVTRPEPLPGPLAALPISPWYQLPLDVLVNDVCVLRAVLCAVPSRPPLSVAAGIIGLSAVHPDNPRRRVDMVLLAAARGAADAKPAAAH